MSKISSPLHILKRFSHNAVILSACRTPIGSFNKSLKACPAPMLGSVAVKNAVARAKIAPEEVQELYMGHVLQAMAGQAPARQCAIHGGLPVSTICTTVNKVCASGMKTFMLAAQSIALGHQQVLCVGGMESMSNAPFYVPRKEPSYGGQKMLDSIVNDSLWDVYNQFHMGNCGENTAKMLNISREAQDKYAIESYKRSQEAAKSGLFDKEIVPVTIKGRKGDTVVKEDEEYMRVDTSKFSTLRPAFIREGGTITAANASTLNDGAAAAIVTAESYAQAKGLKPLARILHYCDAEVQPIDFPIAPVEAVKKLMQISGLKTDQIDRWEINEAFSAVALANLQMLKLDAAKVNINGGAVSIGHPLGMSGARITNALALHLKPGQKGVAAICNGGGGASAILLEGM